MKYMQPVRVLAICLAVGALAVTHASAALVGGTYTNGGAPGSTWPATAPTTASPVQYQTMANPTSATVGQGFVNQDGSGAGGALMAEIVTPTTTFTLDTITIECQGAAPTPSGMSLHLYTLGTATAMPNLASDSSAFYFVGTDLLGGGSGNGLPFGVNGFGSATNISFTLDNTGTSDKVTLNAGTSYAVEFWNVTSPYSNTPFTWMRGGAGLADPGGQGFAHPNTTDFGTSRNTIAANGQAGGSPRTFAMALYGTSAAAPGVTGDYNNNGVVDAADYAIWRENSGQSVTIPNDPTPGTVTQADYDYWKAHFSATSGAGAGLSSGGAVPEPSTIVLALVGLIGVGAFRRRIGG